MPKIAKNCHSLPNFALNYKFLQTFFCHISNLYFSFQKWQNIGKKWPKITKQIQKKMLKCLKLAWFDISCRPSIVTAQVCILSFQVDTNKPKWLKLAIDNIKINLKSFSYLGECGIYENRSISVKIN